MQAMLWLQSVGPSHISGAMQIHSFVLDKIEAWRTVDKYCECTCLLTQYSYNLDRASSQYGYVLRETIN